MRHPFPYFGIAGRIIGAVTRERIAIARKADEIFVSMIKEAGIYNQVGYYTATASIAFERLLTLTCSFPSVRRP